MRNESPLIVVANQNCMGFCGGETLMNCFGEEGALRVHSVDSGFPSAVRSREQKRFGAVSGKAGGIRLRGDDGEELEFVCWGIHFVAGNLSGGSIGGKESGAAAVGERGRRARPEWGFARPRQALLSLFLPVDWNLFLSGQRDAHDMESLFRLAGLGGAPAKAKASGATSVQKRWQIGAVKSERRIFGFYVLSMI